MTTKSFLGRDVNEALGAVRASFGPDALILQTRGIPTAQGGKIEVTAMSEAPPTRPAAPPLGRAVTGPAPAAPPVLPTETPKELPDLYQELAEIKSLLSCLAPRMARGTVWEELLQQGLAPEILTRLSCELRKPDETNRREQIRQALTRMITTGGQVETRGKKPEALALIGPTGVGKTTALVKLTTRLIRSDERQIGWVSLDNRRIAGSDQLVVYAGVLGIPCEVVENAEGVAQAMENLSSCDLVLIDTPGMSPYDDEGLADVAACLRGIPDLKYTLLLSATTTHRDMIECVTRFTKVGVDALLFTKLDEGKSLGSMLSTALICRCPLSYVSLGQSVTTGLDLAKPETLVQRLLP